ncbi:MAG: efflux RND transporter periplasmic adaptor subunit, partial [Alphaproteobacteria bacterium]|nr:efflux RND transporter periplasmic adaptor subunit [Alphaproteobacteria bacterium]
PAAVGIDYGAGTGKRLRILAMTVAVVLVLAFAVVQFLKGRDSAALEQATAVRGSQPPAVETVKAEYAPPVQALTLPGETRGWYSSTIYARVNGYLAKWSADIGDRVKKDQVLATIDTPDLDAQLEAARAQLNASEADVQVKEADARFAKTTYERWQASPKGVVSEQDREDKKARYDASVAQLNAARARVAVDQANGDRLNYLTHFKQVTAPFDGIITERRVDVGDLITAGSTANTTPLFGIAQSDRIRVFAEVPQRASVDLAVGNVAKVTAPEHPDRAFEGKVTRTSQSIDAHARTLRVEVDLPNQDLALVPGMYVQVQFQLKPTKFVQVPAAAMLFRASGPQVAVIDADGRVKFQDVAIARDNGRLVELASGLSEGDRVAINISNQIAGGDKVHVVENAQAAAAARK